MKIISMKCREIVNKNSLKESRLTVQSQRHSTDELFSLVVIWILFASPINFECVPPPVCEPICPYWGGCAGGASRIRAGSPSSLPLAVPASACL